MNPRTVAKRWLKWSVEVGTEWSGLGCLYRRSQYFRGGHRILTYHRITKDPIDSHCVHPNHFRAQMAFLADHCSVVDVDDIAAHAQDGKPLEPNSVALTFDDGYAEYGSVAAEILEEYRLPATFFVVTGVLDRLFPVPEGVYLDWNGVKALHQRGFHIGSHCVRHVSLGTLSREQVEVELIQSRERIATEIGFPPSGISYPYGTRRDFSEDVALLTERAGYSWGVTALHGLNHRGSSPFALRRTSMTWGDGPKTFRMIMRGCLDPWAIVDRWGYRLQRPQAHIHE